MSLYLALLHHPIYNKRQDVVTTCITGFDLHDIARSSITFGVKKYFIVNPLPAQQAFAKRIMEFWSAEKSREFNWTRADAFKLVTIKTDLVAVIEEITKLEGKKPKIVATSAKARGATKYKDLKTEMKKNSDDPYLLLFGTGWGMAEEVFDQVDCVLEPIVGVADYNHLSVRSAVAIILDRLMAK